MLRYIRMRTKNISRTLVCPFCRHSHSIEYNSSCSLIISLLNSNVFTSSLVTINQIKQSSLSVRDSWILQRRSHRECPGCHGHHWCNIHNIFSQTLIFTVHIRDNIFVAQRIGRWRRGVGLLSLCYAFIRIFGRSVPVDLVVYFYKFIVTSRVGASTIINEISAPAGVSREAFAQPSAVI